MTSNPDLRGQLQIRQQFSTYTFRLDKAFIEWYTDFYYKQLDTVDGKWEGFAPFSLFQIITREAVAKGQRRGGNSLPFKEEEAPYLNLLYWFQWDDASDDDAVIQFVRRTMEAAKKEAKRRGVFVDYIYMNYASQYQDVLKSYGADEYAKLEAVAHKYDRNGLFQELMTGYFRFGGSPERTSNKQHGK